MNTCTNTEEIFLPYIAGFFDGEGSICIKEKDYRLKASISNTNYNILKQIQLAFGGNIYKRKLVKLKNNIGYCKQIFTWEIEADKALIFLKSINEFCIVKNKQINLGILYRNIIKPCNGRKGMSVEEKEKRKLFISTIKNINHSQYKERVNTVFYCYDKSTEYLFQYIAGFFDAEGCIYIHKSSHMLRIIIAQTNEEILKLIQVHFGGKIRPKNNTLMSDGCNRKQAWIWELSSKNTQHFMKCIRPYILEKKEQIELAIKYQKHKAIIHTLTKLSFEEIKTREEYRLNLIRLKHIV